jgi:hypothetical protein
MNDPDLDRIETNAREAGLATRDVDAVFALARRGLRAERETCRTCRWHGVYGPNCCAPFGLECNVRPPDYCSRWEAKT